MKTPQYEFHILNEIRKKYSVDETLFSSNGNVIFPNFHAAKILAHNINEKRNHQNPIRAGELNAMGLLDEINHYLFFLYKEKENPKIIEKIYSHLVEKFTEQKISHLVKTFTTLFPPITVYKNEISAEEYLAQTTNGIKNIFITLEELLLVHLANINPGFTPFQELFHDDELQKITEYKNIIEETEKFFKQEKPFTQFQPSYSFFDVLKLPMQKHPHNIAEQLQFIKTHWGIILSPQVLTKTVSGDTALEEEHRYILSQTQPQTNPQFSPSVPIYKKNILLFQKQELEKEKFQEAASSQQYSEEHVEGIEQFTIDREWMPNVVVLAKNIYVWLSQLSKKYHRSITWLDEIPDEELDTLARWNFTGLWLIGIWERSNASQKIKQYTGNPEAVPSAYSLYDYEIAAELGGEEAFHNLSERAWQRGIRLAGDMVPNHMGLYSKWVVEHPEYFIQLPYSPYPNYKFTGPNLSEHPTIELRIEDGYWDRKDAAVVFQRKNLSTGEVQYMYHGNDGTNMPWNDTAQLNLLRADVREAVIQNIFHVAKKFSIIRFDAAMTLAKKHFQRLWYPQLGTPNSVPSRAEYGMTREQFDEFFPVEFWREVVDRMNAEMPNTLLLAEAFWLMESYFVRTLGMHRVYNSAFMHMMMKEENKEYRELIKNTLEFNPEILKRYVNFMSNPDEHTAIDQFGTGDKYFGVCLLMVTLPGLPMFAHGQIEGFTEKYGMEYKRAYYDETPNEYLLRRHESDIFPLIKKRYLFSQVENFQLYDFYERKNFVNENVYAYSNMALGERVIVVYNHHHKNCRGSIKFSVPKTKSEETGMSEVKTLGESLHCIPREDVWYIFREYKTGKEYLQSGKDFYEKGLLVELQGYQSHLFMDFREVFDNTGKYRAIAHLLRGEGTSNFHSLFAEMQFQEVYGIFSEILAKENIQKIIQENFVTKKKKISKKENTENSAEKISQSYKKLTEELQKHFPQTQKHSKFEEEIKILFQCFSKIQFKANAKSIKKKKTSTYKDAIQWCNSEKRENIVTLLLCWIILKNLQKSFSLNTIINDVHLEKLLEQFLEHDNIRLLHIILKHHSLFLNDKKEIGTYLEILFNDYHIATFIGIHFHNEISYYHKESFEEILQWFFTIAVINEMKNHYPKITTKKVSILKNYYISLQEILQKSEKVQYQTEKLIAEFRR